MSNDVIAFVQARQGEVKRTNLEAVSEGARLAAGLGGRCVAVVMGSGAAEAARRMGRHGAARAIAVDEPAVHDYNGDVYGRTLAEIARARDPRAVVLSATAAGKDLAPRVAARLQAGYAADCTGVELREGRIVARRPVYAGKAIAEVGFESPVAVLSLRPNNFEVREVEGEARSRPHPRSPRACAPTSSSSGRAGAPPPI
ncbi:MAG: hypothetical protein KatS3mg102_1129 [Planctomycetota bacterium]|nr:MAG: hypothetical protein KatS3mg102_1129 [Planctomycetota bacterium]